MLCVVCCVLCVVCCYVLCVVRLCVVGDVWCHPIRVSVWVLSVVSCVSCVLAGVLRGMCGA